ncbi:MAG: hypothetical protein Ct9H300mP22_7100 [Gammaproteobacteria bacterium]|nr:MAG: hypothetical protein Ct9H300mP22_7100 [Gammaproteobacteria bacterium]
MKPSSNAGCGTISRKPTTPGGYCYRRCDSATEWCESKLRQDLITRIIRDHELGEEVALTVYNGDDVLKQKCYSGIQADESVV